jgi:hypothetical protein
LLNRDGQLLADLGLAEEETSRHDADSSALSTGRSEAIHSPEISEFLHETLIFLEYLRIHTVTRNIEVGDMGAELLPQFALYLFEVERFHIETGAFVDSRFVSNDVGSQRLWETTIRLAEIALEELHNRLREVEGRGAVQDVLLGQIVRHHELGKVADGLRGWRDLYDVATLYIELLLAPMKGDGSRADWPRYTSS